MSELSFSTAVIRGAVRCGFSETAMAAAIKLTAARMKSVLAGKVELTSRQRDAVERLTGKTCGQLAALELEPEGGEFTELMNAWASAAPVPKSRSKSAKA